MSKAAAKDTSYCGIAAVLEGGSALTPGDWMLIAASLLAVCLGYANMSVMPLWSEALIRNGGQAQTPILLSGSLELAGGAVASIVYSRRAVAMRVSRALQCAAAIIVVANLCSTALVGAGAFSLPLFVVTRCISGAGSGLILAAINARITRTAYAERLFIGAHIAFALFAAGIFQVLPRLMIVAHDHAMSGAVAVFLALASFGALSGVLSAVVDRGDPMVAAPTAPAARKSAVQWLLLVMLMLYFCGFTSIYTFWERFGAHAGLSMEAVAQMISAASLTALLGMLGALLVADRIGFIAPIAFCLVMLSMSAFVSSHGGVLPPPGGHALFVGAVIADQTCAIVVVPFVLSLMAVEDPSGAVASAAPSAMSIGNVVGPTIAAFVGRSSFDDIGWMVIGFYLTGFLILLVTQAVGRRRPRLVSVRT